MDRMKIYDKIHNRFHNCLWKILILNIIPIKKNILITCSGKGDGMGAQIQAIFSAILYSKINKKTFIYTPLNKVAHNYQNSNSFEKDIENFFGFNSFETKKISYIYKTYNLDNKSIFDYFKILISIKPILIQKQYFHEYADKYPQNYNSIKSYLKQNFFREKQGFKVYGSKDYLNIAYHIRRGDVHKDFLLRFTSDEVIIENIKKLTQFLKTNNIPYKVHIYSQGDEKDFSKISALGILHLNETPFDTIYNMAISDVLFTAKSSFSYVAALLSKGIVIYESFWHSPLPEWYVLSPDLFSQNNFQKEIKTAFAEKH